MTTTSFPTFATVLANGLRVTISPDDAAPVVAVNIWYNVGARDERPGKTGLAHLFEHLMFEGSRQVAPAEHFTLVTRSGGAVNATTSGDRTNYFETLPADQLDVALWLEADRLGSLLEVLTQESLDKQRDVVRNERRQRVDNAPYGTALGNLCRRLFPPEHPYHHETIGSMDDLAAATLDDVRGFFSTFYAPNNAALTIVGDVDVDDAFERVEHYFGAIPANPVIPASPAGSLPGPLAEEARDIVSARVPDPAVFLGFRLPPEGDVRLDHLELAMTALAQGRGAAFHRRLVQAELAKAASGSLDRRVAGASLGLFVGNAASGVPLDKLEAAMRNELLRLAEDGLDEDELARTKAMLTRRWLDRVGNLEGRADEISRSVTLFGDADRMNRTLVPIAEATADDVRDAARTYLAEAPPVVLWYLPEHEETS